jgi:hypothetical protein
MQLVCVTEISTRSSPQKLAVVECDSQSPDVHLAVNDRYNFSAIVIFRLHAIKNDNSLTTDFAIPDCRANFSISK